MTEFEQWAAPAPFRLTHRATLVSYGTGSIEQLGTFLASRGIRRAMVVCGQGAAGNRALLAAVTEAAQGHIAGVFDGATPDKLIGPIFDGVAQADALEADGLVGLGGGSSLDAARQISVFRAEGTSLDSVVERARTGLLQAPTPAGPATPVVVVPTTFAGACLSSGGTMQVLSADASPDGRPVRISGQVRPIGAFYDPSLFATTPAEALRNSVMNGFDKGLETLYSPTATAFSDALAIHGVRLMQQGLLHLEKGGDDALEAAVAGLALIQLDRRTSVLHVFGQAISYATSVQQGVAHAIFAPHVLRHVFAVADARRRVLATAMGIGTDSKSGGELAAAITGAVEEIRDAIGVATRLGDVLDLRELDREDFVQRVLAGRERLSRAPAGVDRIDAAAVEEILDAAS